MIDPFTHRLRGRRRAFALAASLFAFALVPSALAAHGSAREDRTAYILFSPGSGSSTMSGSLEELDRARKLRAGREGMLYVRHGGTAYVIRDPETLRRAEAIFEPQKLMGVRQGELGSRQAELGSRQAALGAEQARLAARQARAPAPSAEELGRQMEALGRQQEALGDQQEALGRRQEALGREQERLHREADLKFRALIADALRRAVAQRVD